jgi:hypothetical protein
MAVVLRGIKEDSVNEVPIIVSYSDEGNLAITSPVRDMQG